MADGGAIHLGDGVTLTPATAMEFAYIANNLRDGDRSEQAVFGAMSPDDLGRFETCLAFRFGGRIGGYVGTMVPCGASPAIRVRYLSMLTCTECDTHKKAFVRHSREAMGVLLNRMPTWVSEVVTLTRKDYTGAVRWIENVIRMERIREIDIRRIRHTIYGLKRKGAA